MLVYIKILIAFQVQRDEIADIDLTVRFKYGIHTIFLFVDPTSTFSEIASELFGVLKQRYPDGLTPDLDRPKMALPEDASRIEFGVLKSATDPSQGWKSLKAKPKDKAVAKGLKEGLMVAFAFRDDDDEEFGEVVFDVVFPNYDEEMEDA